MNDLLNIQISPEEYTKAAAMAHEVGEEMLARLAWLTIKPQVILDIGCGVGVHSNALARLYPDAKVIAIDRALAMLAHARTTASPANYVCAQNAALPLSNQSVDLIFANFFLPWQQDLTIHVQEWLRVLRPNGVLVLSALGLDTLCEWRDLVSGVQIPKLVDMHEIGDTLVHTGFAEPVLDVTHYTLTYRQPTHLFQELMASGMWVALTPQEIQTLQSAAPPPIDEKWTVTYEVIYAHAFAPSTLKNTRSADGKTVVIPLAQLRQKLKA